MGDAVQQTNRSSWLTFLFVFAAQVEVLLKDSTARTPAAGETSTQSGGIAGNIQLGPEDAVVPDSQYLASDDGDGFTSNPMSWAFDNTGPSNGQGIPFSLPDMSFKTRAENAGSTNWELLGMGLFEALPPTEMIEELLVWALS